MMNLPVHAPLVNDWHLSWAMHPSVDAGDTAHPGIVSPQLPTFGEQLRVHVEISDQGEGIVKRRKSSQVAQEALAREAAR